MTIIFLQVAALVLFAWLLRGLGTEPQPKELPQPVEIDQKDR
jgi:hypothetical protein